MLEKIYNIIIIIAGAKNKCSLFCLAYNSQIIRDMLASIKLLLSEIEGLFARCITSYWYTLEIRTKIRFLRLVNVINYANAFESSDHFSQISLRTLQR